MHRKVGQEAPGAENLVFYEVFLKTRNLIFSIFAKNLDFYESKRASEEPGLAKEREARLYNDIHSVASPSVCANSFRGGETRSVIR